MNKKTFFTTGISTILLAGWMSMGCGEIQKTAPLTLKMASSDQTNPIQQPVFPIDETREGAMNTRMGGPVANVEAIYLDIELASMHFTDPCSAGDTLLSPAGCASFQGWVDLPVDTGLFDIMQYSPQYPVVLLSSFIIPSGKISQLRLILGNGNLVKVDGVVYPLIVPSGSESGYKINIHDYIQPDTYTEILLTMDPSLSVIQQGNGTYSLKPSIKAVLF